MPRRKDAETITASLRDLRAQRKSFREATFSYRDLLRHGISKEEAGRIATVTKYGETRYERDTVWEFIAYQKKGSIKQ